jgi:hypothetical protein
MEEEEGGGGGGKKNALLQQVGETRIKENGNRQMARTC